jgi:hypothetical protein
MVGITATLGFIALGLGVFVLGAPASLGCAGMVGLGRQQDAGA